MGGGEGIMEKENLKPCPFCGGEVVIDRVYARQYVFWAYKVECKRCSTVINYEVRREATAIEAWNRRVVYWIKLKPI